MVEKERVLVGDEERGVRFVVQHGGVHLRFFALSDVRGIGDHDLESNLLAVLIGEQRGLAEDVALCKLDRCMIALGVSAGDGDCFLGDVKPIDIPSRLLLLECNGDTAGASADVQDSRTHPIPPDKGGGFFRQIPGDEIH